ncbi:hypothetical protein OBBRIDRAFT_742042 [Obba rivulosa]|uniref:Amine oxidase domain-containing protein n=1 Tax=Obba rivulosa TaxID=1052685 RepID=A0A8E2AS28_9APHY|nr:hypothetical protein OBBRIDRAFT_742042 [Obba rivulosa]
MILEDLGIDYEILEAGSRIGGRVFTYRFNGETGYNAAVNTPARYDYFDVGAMRFPRIPFMHRVFDLFKRTRTEKLLIEYHLHTDNNLSYFNSRGPATDIIESTAEDYFHVSTDNGGTVPPAYVQQGVDYWTGAVYDYYKNLFAKMNDAKTDEERQAAFQAAWNELVKQDFHSTRSYMLSGKEGKPSSAPPPYPETVVEWLETFDSATGLYNQSFVESNTRASAAQADEEEWDWVAIDGGSDHLVRDMALGLKSQPVLNKHVSKIARVSSRAGTYMEVTIADPTPVVKKYSQVICTVPLGCLAVMDTENCDLSYNQKQAIRSLHYDASVKVGLKFQKRWWEDPKIMPTGAIVGGQSSTDIPIRTCVYPSYGLDCPASTPPPGVLLASYTWAQDARRLGSIISPQTPLPDNLVNLTLSNLERLHGISRDKFGPVLATSAYNWEADPRARGAFALFGPAQFGRPNDKESLFTSLKAPAAKGRLHIAGEATSVHHAWVLGALNSAWRAVYMALLPYGEAKRRSLINRWGIPDEDTEEHLQQLSVLALYDVL